MKRTGGSAGSRIGSVCVGALAACVALVSGGTLTAQAYEAKAGAEPRLVDWQGETAFDWSDLHTKGNFFLNRVYFKNQYIIGLAGNVDPGYYPVKRTLQWEGKDYPLCFAPGMEAFADNGEVLEAARQCLGDLIEEYSLNVEKFETKVEIAELTTLLVTSVAGPYTEKPDVLAERFFAQRELSNLAAVAREVSPGTADALAGRAYEEREVALFSIVIDRASGAKLEALFDRAVEEREVAFASILSGRLPGEKGEALKKLYQADMPSGIFDNTGSEEAYALAKRAYEDDKIAFFSQLADDLSADKARELAMRAYKDDKMAFFSHLADGLSAQDAQDLAVRAYEDDKIAFFSQLADDLSADKARELAMRAYTDDKIAFFSHLADGLSAQDAQDLAVRAYEDGKIAFFSHLADALTAQQRAQLRERAYRDNELAFFTHLFD